MGSAVSTLNGGRGPPAVFGVVRAVVVAAVDLMFRGRPAAHVRDEVGEPVPALPPVTDRDAPAAVVGVLLFTGVAAPASHLLPDSVFGGPAQAVSLCPLTEKFSLKAAATFGGAVFQSRTVNDCGDSAFASTVPLRCSASGVFAGVTDNSQAAKYLADEILEPPVRRLDFGRSVHGPNISGPAQLWQVRSASCGRGCAACVPLEQYLENVEKGRPADYRPVVVPGG
jgi:hypothetical protein